jgi:hypothetical protein
VPFGSKDVDFDINALATPTLVRQSIRRSNGADTLAALIARPTKLVRCWLDAQLSEPLESVRVREERHRDRVRNPDRELE